MVDPAQLETAILNLCINARDAMPDGGRMIVSVGRRSVAAGGRDELAAGDYIKLAISDTGTGMSEAVRLRAFEPFFTTKEVGKGTGLGLSMVYGFARQSGGSATIESKIGVGTRVTLLLPVAREAVSVAAPDVELVKPPAARERILLCEDDAMVRLRVEEMLSGLGYRVTAVGDAPAALDALLKGEPYDLLFTDIVMPGAMNGTQLAREARRQHPQLHLLFTSGHAEQALSGIEDFERGAVLLKKPYRRSELAARVREALANNG
jgi:CheY-like chemotaxis protein